VTDTETLTDDERDSLGGYSTVTEKALRIIDAHEAERATWQSDREALVEQAAFYKRRADELAETAGERAIEVARLTEALDRTKSDWDACHEQHKAALDRIDRARIILSEPGMWSDFAARAKKALADD
jgi:uncharacterized coiled-coil DUF342 family protein